MLPQAKAALASSREPAKRGSPYRRGTALRGAHGWHGEGWKRRLG